MWYCIFPTAKVQQQQKLQCCCVVAQNQNVNAVWDRSWSSALLLSCPGRTQAPPWPLEAIPTHLTPLHLCGIR